MIARFVGDSEAQRKLERNACCVFRLTLTPPRWLTCIVISLQAEVRQFVFGNRWDVLSPMLAASYTSEGLDCHT